MAIIVNSGTPFVGYASLTNATPGPVNFALFTVMGQAAYTLAANERLYLTNITLSTNDTAGALVTVDTGGITPTKLISSYASVSLPPAVESIPPGICRGVPGVAPRASATSVTSGKTIECVINGFIQRSAPDIGADPSTIVNLFAWYRSDLGITLNTTTVNAWADQSGNGNTASQGTPSAQPTYTAIDSVYGGQPSLSFSAASSQFLRSTASLAQPDTIFVVGHAVPNGTNTEFIDGSSSSTRQLIASASAGGFGQIFAGTLPVLTSATATVTAPCAMIATMNGASSVLYINNSNTAAVSGNAGTNSISSITIGGFAGGFLNGKVVEVALYSRVLSQAERAVLMAYAARRYGIAAG